MSQNGMSDLKLKGSDGRFRARHGMYGTRLYHIWNGLSGRCLNPNNKNYADYGGRGITVCDEWRKPENFFRWALLSGYDANLTLDRIDVNGGYCPENCRWITNAEQQRNRRNNRMIEYNGEIHCASEWAEITGIAVHTILSRLKYGWPLEHVLTIPPSRSNTRIKNTWNRRADNAKPMVMEEG